MAIARSKPAILTLILGLAVASAPTRAEEPVQPSLSLDLNALEQVGTACRLVFVATNGTGSAIEEMALETVLFNTSGTVDRFALFDFQALPEGKTRFRQFDLPDMRCGDIGRVLVNGAQSCKGASLKGTECMDRLELKSSSKTEIVG